jgi:ribonuclease VapC
MMANETVLDASAILADIFDEPGAEVVRAALADGRLSAVNLAEVVTKLLDEGLPADEVDFLARRLTCAIEPADRDRAVRAALLHQRTRRAGISLGDRFCLALAQEIGAPVLTADRRWNELDLGVEVRLIR